MSLIPKLVWDFYPIRYEISCHNIFCITRIILNADSGDCDAETLWDGSRLMPAFITNWLAERRAKRQQAKWEAARKREAEETFQANRKLYGPTVIVCPPHHE